MPFADMVRFIWEGTDEGLCPGGPIQQDVTPGALEDASVAVVRGRVIYATNAAPVAMARVTVVGQPEVGFVETDGAGYFMIAARGGRVTVDAALDGHLPVQRSVIAPPGRFSWSGIMALSARDSEATTIRMESDDAQIHRASTITDEESPPRPPSGAPNL
jgi:hypothetical protein